MFFYQQLLREFSVVASLVAVLLKGGEISTFVGFIKSGYCNVYRETEALVKLPLGKMVS